jgi:hypothetical protein
MYLYHAEAVTNCISNAIQNSQHTVKQITRDRKDTPQPSKLWYPYAG